MYVQALSAQAAALLIAYAAKRVLPCYLVALSGGALALSFSYRRRKQVGHY